MLPPKLCKELLMKMHINLLVITEGSSWIALDERTDSRQNPRYISKLYERLLGISVQHS
jgi:hypothetical protein